MQRRSTFLATLVALALAGAAFACSRTGPVVRERLPDGTFSFKCDGPLSFCLSHVDEVCKGGPYVVEIGWDQPSTRGVDETRVETHRSQAIVRCLRRGENPRNRYAGPVANPVIEGEARNASPAPTAKPAARACVPGSTQACVGAAACPGGQSCLSDGSGFGPCDCGAR